MLRFPTRRINATLKTLARIPITPKIVVNILASSGTAWACSIWTIYGRIPNNAQNCIKNNKITINVSGFNVFIWSKARHFSHIFELLSLCLHSSAILSHGWQICDIAWICWSASNSIEIASDETPPRRQRKAFRASPKRSFAINQIGASGI